MSASICILIHVNKIVPSPPASILLQPPPNSQIKPQDEQKDQIGLTILSYLFLLPPQPPDFSFPSPAFLTPPKPITYSSSATHLTSFSILFEFPLASTLTFDTLLFFALKLVSCRHEKPIVSPYHPFYAPLSHLTCLNMKVKV